LYGNMDLKGNWVIPPTYVWAESFENGLALVRDRKGGTYFIDRNGVPMTEEISCNHFYGHGDYWYFLDSKSRPLAVYDRMGQPVKDFPTVGVGQMSLLEDDWVSATTAEALIVVRGPEIHRFSADLGKVGGICDEGVLLGKQNLRGGITGATFVNWEGEVLSRWPDGDDVYLKTDDLTGKSYVTVEFYEENRNECYDLGGAFVAAGEGSSYPHFCGGLLYRTEKGFTTLTDPAGETVFCWPIRESYD
ncbi:MAG: WG repeat-containing protein, partial [Oscillospiraceae bacterium]|nr:WG repeat-containing protein [Oscillospiraceae bacterium]